MRILVLDDSAHIAGLVAEAVRRSDLAAECEVATIVDAPCEIAAAGHFDVLVAGPGLQIDELAAALQQAARCARRSARLQALGAHACGISHEIRNLLMGISGFTEMLSLQQDPGTELARLVQGILHCVERASELTHQLMLVGMEDTSAIRPADLNSVIREFGAVLQRLVGEHIAVELITPSGSIPVLAELGEIEQILLNLAANARDAMPGGGKLTVSAGVVGFDQPRAELIPGRRPGQFAELRVTDTGWGMDPETLARAFEPAFTSGKTDDHLGLGLTVVREIAQKRGGWVEAESEPGEGSTFRVYFPVSPLVCEERHTDSQTEFPGGDETVLVAEDDPLVLQALSSFLRECGYRVLCASTAYEAENVIREHTEEVSLAILDIGLPGEGKPIQDLLAEVSPGVRFLLITAWSGEAFDRYGGIPPGIQCLSKPFPLSTLARLVREVLDS